MEKKVVILLLVILIGIYGIYAGELESIQQCFSVYTNFSFSEWRDIGSCNSNDLILQERSYVQLDANNCTENNTIFEYKNASCDYCMPEINEMHTNWICGRDNIKTRTKYYIDAHFNFCCNVTGLASDCILDGYDNETETGNCDYFNLNIKFPLNGMYNTKKLNLSIKSDVNLSKIEIIDSFEKNPKWKLLCKKCNSYFKASIFDDGVHNISVRGFLADGLSSYASTSFIIDTKVPVVNSPRIKIKGYTNGNFYINYSEPNLDSITLVYSDKNITRTDCSSGKYQECNFFVNLSDYSGEEISFYFVLKDQAGNVLKTKPNKAIVDVILPKIIDIDYPVILNDIYFDITLDEPNFYQISYFDSTDPYAKWKVLCSRLVNGACNKKITFKTGVHNLTLKISDKAGNYILKDI